MGIVFYGAYIRLIGVAESDMSVPAGSRSRTFVSMRGVGPS